MEVTIIIAADEARQDFVDLEGKKDKRGLETTRQLTLDQN